MSNKIIKLVASRWTSLNISPAELRLDVTLNCGQVFRWKPTLQSNKNRFVGVIDSRVIELQQTDTDVLYRSLVKSEELLDKKFDEEDLIKNYFHLGKDSMISTVKLYDQFAKCDPLFAKVCKCFPGLRVIRQDPFECLMSFICTSNNNIGRICGMLERLCRTYGDYLGEYEEENNRHEFYRFPTFDQLEKATEKELKDLGFGYRAKYIVDTVKKLKELNSDGKNYLYELKKIKNSAEVLEKLTAFPGVGLKVASCVALYSLDAFDCVPMDVHMLRIAKRHYVNHEKVTDKTLAEDKSESLTPAKVKKYMQIFVDVFGMHCGWAQMVLFAAQIAAFKDVVGKELIDEIKGKVESKKRKTQKKNNISSKRRKRRK